MSDSPQTSQTPETLSRTLLITLTGRDRPGVTSRLFDAMAAYDVEVLDIEQVLVRGRLILAVLVAPGTDETVVRQAVQRVAAELDMDVEIAAGIGDEGPRHGGRAHVALLGAPLRPRAVAGIAGRIAASGGNIDRIVRLARYPITSIEFDVSGADPGALRVALAEEAVAQHVDVAVQPSGLLRRAKRLVVMDVDSTLVQGEVIELLAARAGCLDEVAAVTGRAMRGELDFEAALRARVALLAGLDATAVDDVRKQMPLTPGARTLLRTLKRLGYSVGLVSGGFTQVTDHLVHDLGFDYAAANSLEIVDGRLTGRLVGSIVDRPGKAAALERFAAEAGVPLAQTVAIGDGANDLDMIARAGLGIAFNAKPIVRQAADASVTVPYLDAILYLLGITREEIEAADLADGFQTPAPAISRT
jgi:phosphoserine phosphatase